jgi:hypothetical protein
VDAEEVTCDEELGAEELEPLVTGQIVVYRLIISVVTEPRRAGQSVTVGWQDVTVYTVVP